MLSLYKNKPIEKFPNLREPIQNFPQNIIAVEEKEMIIQIGRKEH